MIRSIVKAGTRTVGDFVVQAENFEEFKKQFPKHFGNIVPKAPNRAQEEKTKVRNILVESHSFEEFERRIYLETRWKIKTHHI